MLTDKQKQVIDEFLVRPSGSLEYPGSIEKLTRKKVSRVWARTVCDRLALARVLEEVSMRSPTKSRPTPHYRLKPGTEGLRNLVRPYVAFLMQRDGLLWQKGAWGLMRSDHLRHQLTVDLVRKVLSSKNVAVHRNVTLNGRKWPLLVLLPVSHPGSKERPKHRFVNPEVLSAEEAREFSAWIDRYYAEDEPKSLLIPILALIEVSPSALVYFLGKWRPYVQDTYTWPTSANGADQMEHVLFRMIWGALNDLSVTRLAPEGSDVKLATVRAGVPGPARESEHSLLTLNWQYEADIEYDAGFDTDELVYGEELYVYEKNPENAWVSINWREVKRPSATAQREQPGGP